MAQAPNWLDQVHEEIIDPDRRIVDPHHHLWHHADNPYLLEDLWSDTSNGHLVEKTVFVECMAEYLTTGPEELRPVGETSFVAAVAAEAQKGPKNKARIGAIVSFADLMLGDRLDDVLDAHVDAGQGLFRGIRHAAGWDASSTVRNSHTNPPQHLYADRKFRDGFRRLGERGLTFDAWSYHPQISELTDLAKTIPETRVIFDHFGGPLGVGPYAGHRDEIFATWKEDTEALAHCPNVFAKIGGLAMPINGFGWHKRSAPANSDEIVDAHKRYYDHMIRVFGPQRCMFESNFPVDKQSVSYRVLWNAFKKIAADYTEAEKDALFRGTATQVYRIEN